MSNKIISIDTLRYYNDKVSNYVDEKVSDTIDNLGLDELNAVLVDTDATADDPIIPDYITETELNTALSGKMDKVTLAKVATSGNYNDLSNKPTIPAAVTESTVSGWGFTKNTGTYSKPSGGIPKSDLASAVQTSLGKADTALQSYTEQYKGTVTGVKVNGTTKSPSSGTVDIGNVVTSVKINGSSKSPSSGVVDLGTVITEYQPLKTINGESIVGSGNIVISGGGGDYLPLTGGTIKGDLTIISGTGGAGNLYVAQECSAGYFNGDKYYFNNTNGLVGSTKGFTLEDQYGDYVIEFTYKGNGTKFLSDDGTYKTISSGSSGGSGAYSEVNHGTNDTTFTLTPNTFHVWDEVTSLTLDLGSETTGVANEYLFQFTSGATATSLTLPDDIKWANELTIEPNMIYQVSILKGLASVLEFKNIGDLIENKLSIISNGMGMSTFIFEYPVASDVTIQYINIFGDNGTSIIENGTQSAETSFDPGNENIVSVVINPSSDNTYIYTT